MMTERIATPFTNEHFAAFCLSMVGQPYWYGTVVYKCSDSLLSRKAKQYPSHYGSSRTSRYKQDIAAKKVCADCVGGCKGYAWTGGGKGVLESIGTSNVFSSKYGSNGCPDKGANSMFSYAKSKGMQELLLQLGYALPKYGADGEFGSKTEKAVLAFQKDAGLEQDGKYGDKTHAALMDAVADDDEGKQDEPQPVEPEKPEEPQPAGATVVIVSEGGKVNIRCGNGTEYSRLSSVAPGTTFAYVATAKNGWHAVVNGAKVGWVSGEFSRILGGD